MKQTAVEWLVEELTRQNMFMHLFAKEIEKAKEMEKDQIIDAADWNVTEWQLHDGEQYYNETFNKK
jgi:hypothetical protein